MNNQLDKHLSDYKELYRNLLDSVADYDGRICTFYHQAGKYYLNNKNNRILFVGKANNGWINDDRNVESLFDITNKNRIVNRDDQMEWIKNLEGKKVEEHYNTRKSAFFRLMKRISVSLLENKNDWYNYVAWTNLYKIAPWEGGNPTSTLKNMQQEYCAKILEKDFEFLNPSIIIFLTSRWENDLLKNSLYKNNKKEFTMWGKYKTYHNNIDEKLLIYSLHPQGKSETKHHAAIKNIVLKK